MTGYGHYCGTCGGPCATWKGSVHGWTCGGCVSRYVEEQVARYDTNAAKRQQAVSAMAT